MTRLRLVGAGGACRADPLPGKTPSLRAVASFQTGFAELLRQTGEHDVQAGVHLAREVMAKRMAIFELEADHIALHAATLILVDKRDALCLEPSLMMRKWMPHAGHVVFSTCGHTPILEEPSLFNLHVAEFLGAVEAGQWAGWCR